MQIRKTSEDYDNPNEDLRTFHMKKQKRHKQLQDRLTPPDFDVFVERTTNSVRELHGHDLTDDQIRIYLHTVWEAKPDKEREKYRRSYQVEYSSAD